MIAITETVTAESLVGLSPVEVDTIAARIDGELADAGMVRFRAAQHCLREMSDALRGTSSPVRYDATARDIFAAWDKANGEVLAYWLLRVHIADQALDRAIIVQASLDEQAEICEAAWIAGGCWSRAFLVSRGHAHTSRNCSTCHHGKQATQFFWLPQFSGKTEAELVEATGERICSTCVPEAPVTSRKSVLFTDDERAAEEARQVLAARKAEIAATKAAKAITALDGLPMRDSNGYRVETLAAAKTALTDCIFYTQVLKYDDQGAWTDESRVLAAVAAKESKTTDQVWAEATKRAEKRK